MPAKKKLIEEVAEMMATGAEPPTPATVAPPPSGTRAVTDADLAADREFVASLDDAADVQPPAAADLGDVAADVPEAVATEEPTASHEPTAAASAAADRPTHGSINAMVKDLLADPGLSYEAIVDRVKAAHPGARTTARSVASTASVMRRKGETVPMRRK
jgi:hypothetical protein